MLELYEQNKAPPSQGSEVEGSVVVGTRAAVKESAVSKEQVSGQIPSCSSPQNSSAREVPPTTIEKQSNDGSAEMGSVITDHKLDVEIRDSQLSGELAQNDNDGEMAEGSVIGTQQISIGDQDRVDDTDETAQVQRRDDLAPHESCSIGQNLEYREGALGQSPKEAIKMIDKDKVKAALEKRRKARMENTLKKDDVMDEDDFIERELEDGLEIAVEDEKNKWEGQQHGSEYDNADCGSGHMDVKQQEKGSEKASEYDNADCGSEHVDVKKQDKGSEKANDSPVGQPNPSYDDKELKEDVNQQDGVPYEEGIIAEDQKKKTVV